MQIQAIDLNPSFKTELYYFWDEQADEGEQIFSLPLPEIKYMELSDESYDPANYIVPNSNKA